MRSRSELRDYEFAMSRLYTRTVKIDGAAGRHMGSELIENLKDLACDSSLLAFYLLISH
jgi:hypothetical protein